MEHLVSFRKGIDSLSDTEYQRCILSFLQRSRLSFHRETTLNLLFRAFHDEIRSNITDSIQSMNSIISQIIISRKDEQEEDGDDDEDIDIAETTNPLNRCSSRLIAEIASYLVFRDKVHFESCSRSCFIGVRSIKSPTFHLDADDFTKMSKHCQSENAQIPSLQSIKSLTVSTKDVAQIIKTVTPKLSDHGLFDSITSLRIEYRFPSELDSLLCALSQCDLSLIRTLRVIQIEDEGAPDSETLNRLTSMITSALRVEYLEYTGYLEYGGVHFPEMDWMANLRGLALNNLTVFGDEYKMMQRVFGALSRTVNATAASKLSSFHQGTAMRAVVGGEVLDGVNELCIPWKQRDESIARMWTERNLSDLQRVHFRNGHEILDGERDSDSDSDIDHENDGGQILWNRRWIEKVVNSVEYLSVDVDGETDGLHLFDVLIGAMEQNTEQITKETQSGNRKRFKLRVCGLDIENEGNLKGIMQRMQSMMTVINEQCDQWMMVFVDWTVMAMDKHLSATLDHFWTSLKCQCTVNITRTEDKSDFVAKMKYNAVITNPRCTINGIQERWTMTCKYCRGGT